MLFGLARHDEALAGYDRALALAPRHVEALNNRGIALLGLMRYVDAVASYDRALAIKPDNAEVHANRGNALCRLCDLPMRWRATTARWRCSPTTPTCWSAAATRLRDARPHEEAIGDYAPRSTLRPDYPFAQGQLLHARMSCCDWTD